MTIIIANDTGSFSLKEAVKKHLQMLGYDVLDLGTGSSVESMTYVDAGSRASEALNGGKGARAVLFCGSGAGVMMVANKYQGIYAVVCESRETARSARVINDANVLCLGTNVVETKLAEEMAQIFLETGCAEGLEKDAAVRINSLLEKVREIETQNYKSK